VIQRFILIFSLAIALLISAEFKPCFGNPDPGKARKIQLPVDDTPVRGAVAGSSVVIWTLQGHLISLGLEDSADTPAVKSRVISLRAAGEENIPRDGFRSLHGDGHDVIGVTFRGEVLRISSADITCKFVGNFRDVPQILIGKGSKPHLVDDPGPAMTAGKPSASLSAGKTMPGGWTVVNRVSGQKILATPSGLFAPITSAGKDGSEGRGWKMVLEWPETDSGTPLWSFGFSEKTLLAAMGSSMTMGCNGIVTVSDTQTASAQGAVGSGITAIWSRGSDFVVFRLYEKALVIEPGREKGSNIQFLGTDSLEEMAVMDLDSSDKGTLFVTTSGLYWLKAE
jgi:hypothetical protein